MVDFAVELDSDCSSNSEICNVLGNSACSTNEGEKTCDCDASAGYTRNKQTCYCDTTRGYIEESGGRCKIGKPIFSIIATMQTKL